MHVANHSGRNRIFVSQRCCRGLRRRILTDQLNRHPHTRPISGTGGGTLPTLAAIAASSAKECPPARPLSIDVPATLRRHEAPTANTEGTWHQPPEAVVIVSPTPPQWCLMASRVLRNYRQELLDLNLPTWLRAELPEASTIRPWEADRTLLHLLDPIRRPLLPRRS